MQSYKAFCKKHGLLDEEKVIKKGIRNGIQEYRCKTCMKEIHKAHYEKNKEKVRAKHEEYKARDPEAHQKMKRKSRRKRYWDDPEKAREQRRTWAKENREVENKRNARYKRRAIEELRDSYIKSVLINRTSLSRSDIPEDMIKLKKLVMQIKRDLNKLKENRNEQEDSKHERPERTTNRDL